MDREQFWRIIDSAVHESQGKLDVRRDSVLRQLVALPESDILDFGRILLELADAAYRWDLWAAAYIIDGGCSDDGFDDFRMWLISRGRDAYDAALRDPETLAEWQRGEQAIFFETFRAVPREAYAAKTGHDLGPIFSFRGTRPPPREPVGERWERDEELAARFPKLYALFWGKNREQVP